jgi:hypothetical protein
MARFGKTLLAATVLMSAASANAAVMVLTADPFNGVNAPGGQTVTTWNFVLPVGQEIQSAVFTSSFGNDENPSSAVGNVTVGGILVATCIEGGSCFESASGFPTPILYNFGPSEFTSLIGSFGLVYNQTGCCIPRLGASTLTITYGAPVPEPSNWALLIAGFGLVGAAMRRRAIAAA